jgi:hypothetical protein
MQFTADRRWFCNAVIASQNQDGTSCMQVDATSGQTYLVENGVVRPLSGGVEEYEAHMEAKVRKRVGLL